jgi:hypothetical protein
VRARKNAAFFNTLHSQRLIYRLHPHISPSLHEPIRMHSIQALQHNMSALNQSIAKVEQTFAHVFVRKAFCAEALQMSAPQALLAFDGGSYVIQNNKRLAVLGDAALALVLCKKWYKTGTSFFPYCIIVHYLSPESISPTSGRLGRGPPADTGKQCFGSARALTRYCSPHHYQCRAPRSSQHGNAGHHFRSYLWGYI